MEKYIFFMLTRDSKLPIRAQSQMRGEQSTSTKQSVQRQVCMQEKERIQG